MSISNSRKIKIVGFLLITVFLTSIILNLIQFQEYPDKEISNLHTQSENHLSTQILEDSAFDSPLGYWNNSVEGDDTDVNATNGSGVANFEILGDKREYNFYSDLTQDLNWNASINPNFPAFPDHYELNSNGACVSHYWNEGADQSVAVNWDRTLQMPVNISDYIITSANMTAIFNATVQATSSLDDSSVGGDEYTGAIDVLSDDGIDQDPVQPFQASTGDFVRFYVLVSDPESDNVFEVAHYQTSELGQDSPEINHMNDTIMVTVPEETLVYYLTTVLGDDFKDFSISVGMRIWCEDNFAQDADNWTLLILKSVNLTFSYEKIIDQFTHISWKQHLDRISDISKYNIEITKANLNFKYKIDRPWPSLSPNSEIRIFVNNIKILGLDKLIDANITDIFQEVKIGGFDIISLISKDDNVSIEIQLYIADEFISDQIIKISIDDVFLEISYIEFIPEGDISAFLLSLLITALLIIIGILGSLSLRSYVILPRQQRKKSYLMLRTQKFKDIRNLQAIIAMHKFSGLPLYSQSYSPIMKGKKTLFSGFIQAVSIIGEEMTRTDKKDIKMKKDKNKIDFQKVVELDLKQFYCLVLDVEELRTVLILKSKSSKRLKEILLHFTYAFYVKIFERLKNWNHDLKPFDAIIQPLIYEYFDIYYKDPFKVNIQESELLKYKKKLTLSKFEFQIMNIIFLILKEKSHFKLMDILERETDKNEDEIINALESLIEYKLIKPFK